MQQARAHTGTAAAGAGAAAAAPGSSALPLRPYVSLDHLYVEDADTAAQLREEAEVAAAAGRPPASPVAPAAASSSSASAGPVHGGVASPKIHSALQMQHSYGGLPTIPENSQTRSTQSRGEGDGGAHSPSSSTSAFSLSEMHSHDAGGAGMDFGGGGGSTPASASHSLTASSSYSGFLAISAATSGAFPPPSQPPLWIATGSPEMMAPLPPPPQGTMAAVVATVTAAAGPTITSTRLVQVGSPEHAGMGLSQSSSGSSSSVFSPSPSGTAIGGMIGSTGGGHGGCNGGGGSGLVSATGDDSGSSSSLSSTFSTSLNHWHRFPPSVFLAHACLLMMVCGFVGGIARGALGLGHSHSGLVGLMRAGVGLDYHATLIAAFTSGSSLPEGTHCSEVMGPPLNSTYYSPNVLEVCRQAASQSLLYSRVFQAIQCLLLLLCAPTVGRLSDCSGRQVFVLLALLLNVLPQLFLVLHFALGLTPLVFMASQCLPALAPLPLMLLIYVSDVVVQHTSARGVTLETRKQTIHGSGSSGGGEGSIGRDSSKREREALSIAPPSGFAAAGAGAGSQISSGPSDDPASILSSSGSGYSSRRYASPSPAASPALMPSPSPQQLRTHHRATGSASRGRSASRPHRRHSGALLGLGLRKLFAFGLLLSVWCFACVAGMWVSTAGGSGLATSHIWDAGVGLALATLSVTYGLFLPESLVPFHRMLLPAVLLPTGVIGPSVSIWTLGPRVWRELLSHFSLLRYAVSMLLLSGCSVGFMLGSFVPYLQHHALNSWDGSPGDGSGHLFPASGLDYADVMWLGSAMLMAAGVAMSAGCYVASALEWSLHRLTQALVSVLVLACGCAFLLRTHILFSFLCAALLGLSLAAFPTVLAWVALQFDVSEQGKLIGTLLAPAWAGVTVGFILAGVGYDALMESSTASASEVSALSVPELRLFSLPLVLSLLSLALSLWAPPFVTVSERMKYVRHRPTGQWSGEHSASGASASLSGSAYSSASQKSVNPLSHSGGSGGRGSRSSLADYVSDRDEFRGGEPSQSYAGGHTPGLSMQRHPSLPLIRESSLSLSQSQHVHPHARSHGLGHDDDDDDHYLEPYDAQAMREVHQAIDGAGTSGPDAASLGVRDLEANHKHLQQSLLR